MLPSSKCADNLNGSALIQRAQGSSQELGVQMLLSNLLFLNFLLSIRLSEIIHSGMVGEKMR